MVVRRWAGDRDNNIGVATGPSELLVIDLDDGRGQVPPARFAGARNGREALAILAAELGEQFPTSTFEVETASRGKASEISRANRCCAVQLGGVAGLEGGLAWS